MVMGRYRSTYSIRGGVLMNFNLTILNQYFRFIHIVTLTPSGYAQGYAVGRNYDAVLRGTVRAEDDRARVVIHISRLCQWL